MPGNRQNRAIWACMRIDSASGCYSIYAQLSRMALCLSGSQRSFLAKPIGQRDSCCHRCRFTGKHFGGGHCNIPVHFVARGSLPSDRQLCDEWHCIVWPALCNGYRWNSHHSRRSYCRKHGPDRCVDFWRQWQIRRNFISEIRYFLPT